jgi:hypothetical protein
MSRPFFVGREHRMASHICPACGRVHSASHVVAESDPGVVQPRPGDFSLCIGCGSWAVFTAEDGLRRPSGDELRKIGADTAAQAVRRAWNAMNRARKRHGFPKLGE